MCNYQSFFVTTRYIENMNKSFKKIAALLLTVIVLVSCDSKKDNNASLMTTKYLSADITEVKKPFNQTNKDDSFINNNFFLFVEMKCDEEMGDRLNYLNYYYDRKVKYFNELHEDINYITAYSITNWITLGEYRHNRDELGEVYEVYCKALVDYLSQFTTFLIYVSNPNKNREYYAHTYIGSDVGENYELHEENAQCLVIYGRTKPNYHILRNALHFTWHISMFERRQ